MGQEDGENDSEDVELSATGVGTATGTATISYRSGFPKRQLDYAKRARDRVGEIEVTFGGDVLMVPEEKKREHERNTISALSNSLAFLEGQKYWFIYRLDEGDWEFDNREQIQKTGWNGLEDAFVRMLEVCGRETGFVKDSDPYEEVKELREFRNDILHFESPMVQAGNESEVYDVDSRLEELGFPENTVGAGSSYPFKWFSYELAERSVRMSYTLWRFFARQLDKEDEFLTGVPSP